MQTMPLEKFHSLPNIRASSGDAEARKLYSLSLTHLRRNSEFTDYHHKPSPFNIRWIHGYNPQPGVINLNDLGSTTVFYAASYCGVIYNWTTNQMRILQGHRHIVTCIASDAKGRWLVTADSGPENIVIIWDAIDYFPQRTLYSPHGPMALAKVAISADAKYLLTMAYSDNYKTALYWWIWSLGHDFPHAKLEVDLPRDSVVEMGFNPNNSARFILMTKQDIWIAVSSKMLVTERGFVRETDDYELKIRKVPKVMHADNGKLTCYTFVKNTSQVLVATSRGSVLIYSYSIEYKENTSIGDYSKLKFVKVLKMEKHKINVIKSVDGVIVTGNDAGEIHFYEEHMKLVYWIHGFQVDSVRGLSFNVSKRSYQVFDAKCNKLCPCWEKAVAEVDPITGFVQQKLLKQELPYDATAGGKTFIVRDFIVCTNNEGVAFADFVTEKLKTILKYKPSQALSLTVHPEKHLVCIGYEEGFVEMVNFVQHQLFRRLDLRKHYTTVVSPRDDSIKCNYEMTVPELSVTCLKYSPSGLHLACGLNTGQMLFLDPTTLDIVTSTPFHDTNYSIKEISYSLDSLTLAFADNGYTVGVYKYDCDTFSWSFLGKHRAHYKDISALFFLPKRNENGDYKLLSLGTDRIMVEYDTGASSEEYLEVLSLDRVDQTSVPLAGIHWPTPKGLDPAEYRTDLPTILMATNQYKYKIVNYETTMTLSTLLGPRFTHPVSWMQLISRIEEGEEFQYLVFATANIIGLHKLPLDGNPWKHVGLLAHPLAVTQRCFREDLGILFTIGDMDSTMCQWAANYRAPESTSRHGGSELDPYYCLIENGRPGWLFQEIRDLFYYIQILCQGTFSPAMRRVNDYIPIDSLPDLMRALGYFPSEYDVENLIVEAKYKVYLRSPVTEIDFVEFVKLYLNHRPAFSENYRSIRKAFKNFATTHRDVCQIKRDDFIEMLGTYGECFSRELSWYLLSILMGHSFEERAAMPEDDFTFLTNKIIFSDGVVEDGMVYLLHSHHHRILIFIETYYCLFYSNGGLLLFFRSERKQTVEQITLDTFVTQILGIQDLDTANDEFSSKGGSLGGSTLTFTSCSMSALKFHYY